MAFPKEVDADLAAWIEANVCFPCTMVDRITPATTDPDRAHINEELEKMEKPAGTANPKDLRNEIVNFVLRARANNGGRNPAWTSYEKLREVIEKKMFSNTEDLLPVISFNPKSSEDDMTKHQNFVQRMMNKGYTEKQVRLLTEWYLRVRKSN